METWDPAARSPRNCALRNESDVPLRRTGLGCGKYKTSVHYRGEHHLAPTQQSGDIARDCEIAEAGWHQAKNDNADLKDGVRPAIRKGQNAGPRRLEGPGQPRRGSRPRRSAVTTAKSRGRNETEIRPGSGAVKRRRPAIGVSPRRRVPEHPYGLGVWPGACLPTVWASPLVRIKVCRSSQKSVIPG